MQTGQDALHSKVIEEHAVETTGYVTWWNCRHGGIKRVGGAGERGAQEHGKRFTDCVWASGCDISDNVSAGDSVRDVKEKCIGHSFLKKVTFLNFSIKYRN
eukprot:PhM_4_TR17640/c0_g1_i1/m.91318